MRQAPNPFPFSLLSKADLFSHLFFLFSWCVLSSDSATRNQSRSLPVWKTVRPPCLKSRKRSGDVAQEWSSCLSSAGIRGISSVPDFLKKEGGIQIAIIFYSNLLYPSSPLKPALLLGSQTLRGKVVLSIGLWSSLHLPSGNPSHFLRVPSPARALRPF